VHFALKTIVPIPERLPSIRAAKTHRLIRLSADDMLLYAKDFDFSGDYRILNSLTPIYKVLDLTDSKQNRQCQNKANTRIPVLFVENQR